MFDTAKLHSMTQNCFILYFRENERMFHRHNENITDSAQVFVSFRSSVSMKGCSKHSAGDILSSGL